MYAPSFTGSSFLDLDMRSGLTVPAARRGGRDDRPEHRRLRRPSAKVGHGGRPSIPATCSRKARAWKTKRSFWPWPTPGKSIGRPLGDVRVLRSHEDLAVPLRRVRRAPSTKPNSTGPRGRRSPRRARRTTRSPARGMAVRDPGRRERAGRAGRERRGEGHQVLVLDRLLRRSRPWRRGPTAAPSGQRRSVEKVDSTAPRTDAIGPQTNSARSIEVATDVRQRARAGPALVAPAHRTHGVASVVAPVAPVEVHRRPSAPPICLGWR